MVLTVKDIAWQQNLQHENQEVGCIIYPINLLFSDSNEANKCILLVRKSLSFGFILL